MSFARPYIWLTTYYHPADLPRIQLGERIISVMFAARKPTDFPGIRTLITI